MRRLIPIVALTLVLPGFAGRAAAKDYTAQRFDVTIRTLDDGSIQVTETVRMTFEGGPFFFVSRDISVRKTDGVEILGASMDGQVMRRGVDPGQFEVREGRSGVTVRWHFAGTADRSHDFRLSYIALGAVQQADAGSLLEWQALPAEHRYRIETSRILLQGASPDREPSLRTRRVGSARAERSDRGWLIEARDIGANGWVALAAPTTLAAGVVPKWQLRERAQQALAPKMIPLGLIALAIGVSLIVLVWRQDPAARVVHERTAENSPPVNRKAER
jgi:predicted membrane protein DUF2207